MKTRTNTNESCQVKEGPVCRKATKLELSTLKPHIFS